ncbi:uncharacterized protein LOC120030633 [Salvelinus namaycush]|uniref:Uncharacterized protein LOC120030633 n=1 Tax=Salvelinus namaycush TaxID=8040 RepID=A0A8U0PY91_SALNM|nr:uncharacterized protein LOC120030633 [Salvelinus namaycush]
MACKDTPSKIQDTIAISTCINQGPPARYRLVTKKQSLDEVDQLRKWTFGERDPTKVNKTLLIVGETGTGKSTLINAMVNHVLGVEWEDKVWFQIVEEEKGSRSESQTTAVTIYEVFGCEGLRVPFSLTIIDTPGYGDTRGIQEDQLISGKLLEMFRSTNGIHQIDVVGFVVKATENRLSDRQKYIFDSVLSLFGKDMEKNIVALITDSLGRSPKNAIEAITRANLPCAKNDRNQPVHFVFNNCQCEVFDEENEDYEEYVFSQKTAWDKEAKSMDKFFDYKMEPKSVKITEGVLRERKQLEACVSNIHKRVHLINLKQVEVKQTQEAQEKHKKERYTNSVSDNVRSYRERIPTPKLFATTCEVCEENCHYPCTREKDASVCKMMKKNHCTVCKNKCHSSKHVSEAKMYS